MIPRARFDDLRPRSRRSFTLDGFRRTLEAHTIDEVEAVVTEAERQVELGRWVAGFVTYEAAPAFDSALVVKSTTGTDIADLPLAWFGIFDRRRATWPALRGEAHVSPWRATVDEETHAQAVDRIRQAILHGDTYQVNHTFRMHAAVGGDLESLYLDLIEGQSCGYGSLIDTGTWVVASASPELFFEWRHGRLASRPMKGTTARGRDLEDDEARRAELVRSEKERAENLMIVDMVRNDLGRIARVGSVAVPSLFATEKYDTVWQMTSTVTAANRPDVSLLDVFRALFPSASITGAPKVATMKLIAELESTPRGVYCGAVGYGGPRPSGPEWAFNVAIRTVVVHRPTATASYGTGGGVTYDSTPGGEYREALLKTRILDRRATGFSLLETMRWDPAEGYRHLTAHLQRLANSAWYFDVPLDPAEVRSALDAAVRHLTDPARVRLLVARDGTIAAESGGVPPPLNPVRLAVDHFGIDPGDPMLQHKTTERSVYEAAAQRHPEADDVVLVTVDGLVADTTIATICAELDGVWITPPLSDGALPGVGRAMLLAAGRLEERSIPVSDLARATSLARVNSLRGWEAAVLTVPDESLAKPKAQPLRRGR